jgi:hypothetical protein
LLYIQYIVGKIIIMEISKYRLATSDLDQLVNYLADNLPFDYENHSSEMSVLAEEEYHLRSSSTQLNMIIAKKKEDYIHVEIMGCAGGSGLLNCDLGTEKMYLKKVYPVLEMYCGEHSLIMEELTTD